MTFLLLLLACQGDPAGPGEETPSLALTAEGRIGERMFGDGRFAQRYFAEAGGDLNGILPAGDPVLGTVETPDGDAPGPYAWGTVSCATCHLRDEVDPDAAARRRHLNDFTVTPRQTDRGDGVLRLARNMPSLVGSLRSRDAPFFLHSDGEFPTTSSVVGAGLSGRIFGWLYADAETVPAHVAAVLRADDGSYPGAEGTGDLSYRDLLAGTGDEIPSSLRVQADARVDVDAVDDAALFDTVVAYLSRFLGEVWLSDAEGAFTGSPYDTFLARNGLPDRPAGAESDLDYARRLRGALDTLATPVFVDEGTFPDHDAPYVFGEEELAGLRVFLAEPATLPPSGAEVAAGGLGNCLACHTPPQFTDSLFHATAVSQATYERVHGPQSFTYLAIPDLDTRNADPARWLPANAALPDGREPFRQLAVAEDAGLADLGAWNFVANPASPDSTDGLRDAIARAYALDDPSDAEVLDHAIGAFKTPPLRALGASAPYFHDGSMTTLDAVVRFYRGWAGDARAGLVRNPDPRLLGVALEEDDVAALVAFLGALDQDWP